MSEHDPHGTPPNAPGAKLDAGKLRAGLVLGDFARALTAVCEVGTFGAKKYSSSGWLAVPDAHARYTDAMLRRWLKECAGEKYDGESGLTHAAHLAWGALARLDLMIREQEKIHVRNERSEVPTDASIGG